MESTRSMRPKSIASLDEWPIDVLTCVATFLDASELAFTACSCQVLLVTSRNEDLWEAICLKRHWRLRTCGRPGDRETWRMLFTSFVQMSPEERWEAEWTGGGFDRIQPDEYFSGSRVPRVNKHRDVKYSVGQVILNRSGPYRGVIVGWDEITKVPRNWPSLQQSRQPWLSKPHYSVLVHGGPSTYIVDDNIEIERVPTEVWHTEVWDMFTHFNGQTYVPNQTLAALYPEDDALSPLLKRRFCNNCGSPGADRSCPQCKIVRYCSEECEVGYWSIHKDNCYPCKENIEKIKSLEE